MTGVYADVEVAAPSDSGHWVAEENAPDFLARVVGFVRKHTGRT
jgi:hypothetical protein